MVDKVEPRYCAEEEGRVSALSRRNALQVGAQPALAIEGLAGLDLAHHLSHVHLNLAGVLGGTVESDWHMTTLATQRLLPISGEAAAIVQANVRHDRW